jgi:hypothetical protein
VTAAWYALNTVGGALRGAVSVNRFK